MATSDEPSAHPPDSGLVDSTLLTELHHRWSNNLQVIFATLALGARRTADRDQLTALVNEVGRRAAVMGDISRILAFPPLTQECEATCRALCHAVTDVHGCPGVAIDLHFAPLKLDPAQPQILTMLVVELVTNACKHGFAEGDAGLIEIRLSEIEDQVHLMVRDNGQGLGLKHHPSPPKPKIAASLCALLGGELQVRHDHGLVAEARWPLVEDTFWISTAQA